MKSIPAIKHNQDQDNHIRALVQKVSCRGISRKEWTRDRDHWLRCYNITLRHSGGATFYPSFGPSEYQHEFINDALTRLSRQCGLGESSMKGFVHLIALAMPAAVRNRVFIPEFASIQQERFDGIVKYRHPIARVGLELVLVLRLLGLVIACLLAVATPLVAILKLAGFLR